MENKKVGNACRTKNQIRSSKARGSALEYDVWWSLKVKYPETLLTKQLGFQMQYDLRNDVEKFVVECKRHKSIG